MATPLLRIGTRGSPLALAQTEEARSRLAARHPELAADGAIALVVIRTTGDKIRDRPLRDFGGKGLFTKELDEAMLEGRIDIAVNSVKDLPTVLADGIVIGCSLPREDPRDAFVSAKAKTLKDLPSGSVVGTSSPRRQAQILNLRPDLRIVDLRGNVDTRIRKIADGDADATYLALAGLKRLGRADAACHIVSADEMLPAAGQGAIGITCRAADDRRLALLGAIDDGATACAIGAERALLAALGGSCRTPIGALCTPTESGLGLEGLVAEPDGKQLWRTRREAPPDEAEAMGRDAGAELLRRAGPGFIASLG